MSHLLAVCARVLEDGGIVGWDTLRDCVSAAGRRAEVQSTFGGFLSREQYTLRALSEACSHDEPLVQLADLFAGFAVFSRARYADYAKWARLSIQPAFFESDQEASRSDLVRFPLLQGLRRRAHERRLGVSLESRGGLWTARPEGPFSFWCYEPQSAHDRAPTSTRIVRSR